MNRRELLKSVGCSALLIPTSGYACMKASEWDGMLTITNLVPNSNVSVISYGDYFISSGKVTGTKWSCYPPLNTDLRITIRNAQEPPYYKSLTIDGEQVTAEGGLFLWVMQQKDN